ncbi:hypothetical protein ACFYQ5_04030 [Streptomyces sp. NPDC005794]|uniref:hypothetical protein n=1 Tax=Streptomyces sp. NPDC005794 TaxID=3364733 RepID=UPI003691F895
MAERTPASLPAPPDYAAVFTAVRTVGDSGYGETGERLLELAAHQPGFLSGWSWMKSRTSGFWLLFRLGRAERRRLRSGHASLASSPEVTVRGCGGRLRDG